MDEIIFVSIDFRKLKKWQVVDTQFRGLWNSTRSLTGRWKIGTYRN